MKKIILFLILAVFLIGCKAETDYQQPAQQEQQPMVGGGCEVAPMNDNAPQTESHPAYGA